MNDPKKAAVAAINVSAGSNPGAEYTHRHPPANPAMPSNLTVMRMARLMVCPNSLNL